ncbi:MAG: arginine deiminase [Eubacteriaceae bacterium]|jgi:arginine deiminase
MNENILNIRSEIGPLEAVALHRPGLELERITPGTLKEVLFEDIPWLKRMQQEHDAFAEELTKRGTQVLYIEDLLRETLTQPGVRERLIDQVLSINPKAGETIVEHLRRYLNGLDDEALTQAMIAGVVRKDIAHIRRDPVLADFLHSTDPYSFCIAPLPNLYFMRDPGVTVGNGMLISSMATPIRKRESLYLQTIYDHHPLFAHGIEDSEHRYYGWNDFHSLEGGDVLVLSPETVAVGISERTKAQAAEKFAAELFAKDPVVKQVIAVKIPNVRAFMHLDTVFTMVDRNKFTVYPGILDKVEAVTMTRGAGGKLHYQPEDSLEDALKKGLGLDEIVLIESGGGDPVAAAREQWNDSTNTLAIAPGKVVAYTRNERSNEVLEKNGIEVIGIEASELVRGRGGPRCMSMPLRRAGI